MAAGGRVIASLAAPKKFLGTSELVETSRLGETFPKLRDKVFGRYAEVLAATFFMGETAALGLEAVPRLSFDAPGLA